ncbi:putative cyclin-dependent kinase C-1 [Iris pallida]|uniref:Cyclin-dependent kinase C-1 n=1 Tax=Iris pallida TaxID=29817 RepID=A0AAX6G8F6_IRIPA|nr:putative cyclin-dependent kinase C-1 [Iris pallida]
MLPQMRNIVGVMEECATTFDPLSCDYSKSFPKYEFTHFQTKKKRQQHAITLGYGKTTESRDCSTYSLPPTS